MKYFKCSHCLLLYLTVIFKSYSSGLKSDSKPELTEEENLRKRDVKRSRKMSNRDELPEIRFDPIESETQLYLDNGQNNNVESNDLEPKKPLGISPSSRITDLDIESKSLNFLKREDFGKYEFAGCLGSGSSSYCFLYKERPSNTDVAVLENEIPGSLENYYQTLKDLENEKIAPEPIEYIRGNGPLEPKEHFLEDTEPLFFISHQEKLLSPVEKEGPDKIIMEKMTGTIMDISKEEGVNLYEIALQIKEKEQILFERTGFRHRDPKPDNILYSVSPGGEIDVRFIDFKNMGINNYTDLGSAYKVFLNVYNLKEEDVEEYGKTHKSGKVLGSVRGPLLLTNFEGELNQ